MDFLQAKLGQGSSPSTSHLILRPSKPMNDKNPFFSPIASLPARTETPIPPQPPRPPSERLPDRPIVLPKTGRADLCSAWMYSDQPKARQSNSKIRSCPSDQLTYTVPSLAPLRIETTLFCSTSGGDEHPTITRIPTGILQGYYRSRMVILDYQKSSFPGRRSIPKSCHTSSRSPSKTDTEGSYHDSEWI
ncbi:hypothetical protein RSAG8_11194, partial [Rhizoctonia solani AG-8 WAC10335]